MRSRLLMGVAVIAVLTAVGIAVFVVVDDDAEDPPASGGVVSGDPFDAVTEAGSATVDEATLKLQLHVASGRASYEADGLIEPRDGRFRVELGQVTPADDSQPSVVIGLDGEGYESTVEETTREPIAHEGARCWFNPHAPVGSFLGTASVEESVRVIGAVIESLAEETNSVHARAGFYEVVLDQSATHPRDDFRETRERVWGDRGLLARLAGPIEVALEPHDGVARVALELRDYKPYLVHQRGPIPNVRIEAELAPTDEVLEIDPPECQALE